MGRLGKGQIPASQIREHYVQQDGSVFTLNGTDQRKYWNIVVPCAKPSEYITKQKFIHLSEDEKLNYSLIQADMLHDPDVDISKYAYVKTRCFFNLPRKIENFNGNSNYWYNYAYILHDKDTVSEKFYRNLTSERQKSYIVLPEEQTDGYPFVRSSDRYALKRIHYHVVIALENAKTFSKIRNYFGNDIHVEFVENVHSSYLYLTHDTPDAIRRRKYRYDKCEVICNNFDYFENFIMNNVAFEIFDPNLLGKYFFVDGCNNALDIFMRFGVTQTQKWLTSINTFSNLKYELKNACHDEFYVRFSVGDGLEFVNCMGIYDDLKRTDIASSVKLQDSMKELACMVLDCIRFSNYGQKYIYYKLTSQQELNDFENLVLCNSYSQLAKKFEVQLSPFGYSVYQLAGRLVQSDLFLTASDAV